MKKHNKLKRLLNKKLYHFLDVIISYQAPAWEELVGKYEVCSLNDHNQLLEAKRLHAEVYLDRNFITEQVLQDGVIKLEADPHQEHANYFGVINKESRAVEAIARQIPHKEGVCLPIFERVKLKKDYSYVERREIVEISAFVKRRGVDSRTLLLLFNEMFTHSKAQGHRYWLMAVDKKVYWRLKTLFGPVIRRIGPETFYMGSIVVPAEIDMDEVGRLLKRGYYFSLPPLRSIRRILYLYFTASENRPAHRIRFWNAYAKSYDGLLKFTPYQHLIEHVCDITLTYKPRKVLDLGCGTGNVTALLVKKESRLHVDAVDWSRTMLDMIPKKVVGKSVTTSRRDVLSFLELSHERYDVIVMTNVLYTISDRDRLWRLLAGHINERGRIVIANPDTTDSRVLIKSHLSEKPLISLLRPSLVAVWIFDSLISLNKSNTHFDFTSQSELLDELEVAGLCVDGEVGRCYGGHENGIDLLLSIKNKAKAV
ncbi:methyltransferase domain-containing protein [Candidatus Saccharibacteria bacterium]|nr:methyltransferase domain-containing protein [Candidatus Saccharibacteria bacterium]NCU40511.1 methyltransferase domain-containing protein [Candidatus Saccharibacteria bacterium]